MNIDAGPGLRMEAITKHFGGVHALEDVTFEALAGEVHALCGENGAGKSTLMKVLAGAITDHQGRILLRGQETKFAGPRDAEAAGESGRWEGCGGALSSAVVGMVEHAMRVSAPCRRQIQVGP